MPTINSFKNSDQINNKLDINKYLIPYELHQEIFHRSMKNDGYKPIEKDSCNGVYLVTFRRLNKNSNILIYNYVKYPKLFLESLTIYLILRRYYIDYKEFSDTRNYLVVYDKSLDLSNELLVPKNVTSGIDMKYLSMDMEKYICDIEKVSNISVLVELLTRLMYIGSIDDMFTILDKSIQKDFDKLFKFIFQGFSLSNEFVKYKEESVLNSSLYVVRDLSSLIEKIKQNNYIINEGPQKWRGQINSMSSFLNILDLDYRESLYNHYQYHKSIGTLDPTIYSPLRGRSFSFNTIHQNLGNVRWYSNGRTVSRKKSWHMKGILFSKRSFHTGMVYMNRHTLFQDNFSLLNDVINENIHLDKDMLQKKIEETLFNQEKLYSDKNIAISKLNFSEDVHELLKSKKKELNKLLNIPYKSSKRVSFSNELLPWCEKIQVELGNDNMIDLLLGYYMFILTRENINLEDNITPGIPTITAYTEFGKKLCNRYINSKYHSFLVNNKNVNLTQSQFIGSRADFNHMNEDGFYPRIGGYFLWNLCIVNMLEEVLDQSVLNQKETLFYLRIHPNLRNVFIKDNVRLFHLPMKLPMVCPPKSYIYNKNIMKNVCGGFLMNDILYSNSIMNIPPKYGSSTQFTEDNIIVDEVNGLASVPYKINKETLDFVIEYGISKNILIDPEKNSIGKFINNPYKWFNKRDRKKYRSIVSKLLMQKYILNIANIFSNFEKIYFPVRLDFRIRLYCDTEYFDYQKNDLARGMILFAEPGRIYKHDISAINYFKAFGANMFGDNLDKKSLNYRVKWIDKNTELLLNFQNNDLVDKAESQVSFISFCFEYRRFIDYMKNPNMSVFYTYLPIRLDARCNCYQHLALITKENVLYDKLNLAVSSFDDDPNDFYSFILNRVNIYINNKINQLKLDNNLNDKDRVLLESYETLKNASFDRSIVKKTIMTDSYNAGVPKLIDFICVNLQECYDGNNKYYLYKDSDLKIKRNDIKVFVLSLKYVLSLEAPRIKELSKYLDSIASICTLLGIPIPWKLPNGAEISGSYLKSEESTIKAFSFVNTRYTFKKYFKGEYDIRQQKRSLTPNLIHSLDATTISLLYKDFKNIGPVFTIHDCFAVTADNVQKLISKLRIVYTELYSDAGYLMKFDMAVRSTINNAFGDKVFALDSDVIYYTKKKKIIEVPFPNVNEVLNYDLNNTHLNNAMNSSYLLI